MSTLQFEFLTEKNLIQCWSVYEFFWRRFTSQGIACFNAKSFNIWKFRSRLRGYSQLSGLDVGQLRIVESSNLLIKQPNTISVSVQRLSSYFCCGTKGFDSLLPIKISVMNNTTIYWEISEELNYFKHTFTVCCYGND